MKSIALSALTAFLVSAGSIVLLRPAIDHVGVDSPIEEDYSASKSSHTLFELQSELRSIGRRVAELEQLQADVASTSLAALPDDLHDRLTDVELSVRELKNTSEKHHATSADRDIAFKSKISSYDMQSTGIHSEASAVQEGDNSNVPIGNYVSTLGEALHALDAVSIHGMECTDFVCKVTYSGHKTSDPDASAGERADPIDVLALGIENHTVEVRYSTVAADRNVMYISIR